MKNKIVSVIIITLILSSCASIPKETVELSTVLGRDILQLKNSHMNMLELYYDKLEKDINSFIDDVYSPFVIHYVLKSELKKYQQGEECIYSIINLAGKKEGKIESKAALDVMTEFLEDANSQINAKRNELLKPILQQKKELKNNIDKSYENAIYGNNSITAYLESLMKVKESQNKALSLLGLDGKDEVLNASLLKTSEIVNEVLKKGKEIDIKSDEALNKIKELSNKIKKVTNK